MEQHQIPKNVTSFQFKLIGDMTLRQFGYCCAGLLSGYIIFKLVPLPQFVTVTLGSIIAFTGFAAAFIPIQDRPLDKWLAAFIKSIYSPTQFVWQKEGILPDILTHPSARYVQILTKTEAENEKYAKEKLKNYLSTIPSAPHTNLNVFEKKYVDHTLSLFESVGVMPKVNPTVSPEVNMQKAPDQNIPKVPQIPPPQINPVPPQKVMHEEINQPSVNTQGQLYTQKISVNDIHSEEKAGNVSAGPEKNNMLQKQLADLMAEKETLAKQLEFLKSEMLKSNSSQNISPVQDRTSGKNPSVRNTGAKTTPPVLTPSKLPQAPNLISGIIKDSSGKLLANIIITIKDNKGMPLRAIKTNKLGQFETATPLSNGVYFLEMEDPQKKFIFDIAQVTLSGKAILPIVVTAKGEKEIMREKLAKEIFGNAII